MRAVDSPGLHLQPLPAFPGELARTPYKPVGALPLSDTAKIACSGHPDRSLKYSFQSPSRHGVAPWPRVLSPVATDTILSVGMHHTLTTTHPQTQTTGTHPAYDTLSCISCSFADDISSQHCSRLNIDIYIFVFCFISPVCSSLSVGGLEATLALLRRRREAWNASCAFADEMEKGVLGWIILLIFRCV